MIFKKFLKATPIFTQKEGKGRKKEGKKKELNY